MDICSFAKFKEVTASKVHLCPVFAIVIKTHLYFLLPDLDYPTESQILHTELWDLVVPLSAFSYFPHLHTEQQ